MTDTIFEPQFDITPRIRHALEEIERHSWLVENMLIMPKHQAWIRREVQVRRAAGTTRIEGASLDEAEVGRLVSRQPSGNLTEDERANLNAIEAYEFVDYLSDQTDIPIDELVIRQLNRYFMRGAAETLTPGTYRKGQNMVGDFTPPDQGDVPARMRSFALWLREDDETHPVLKAGIAHIHFVAIHPFWDGNGRTARALATLVLQRSKFGFKKLLSIESDLFELWDHYRSAIQRTLGSRFMAEYDATAWLEFFVSMMQAHAGRITGRLTDWHRIMQEFHDDMAEFGLAQRQVDVLAFALSSGIVARSDYIEITGVSPVTASRDLAMLVRKGLLVSEGETRARVYRPVRKVTQDTGDGPR
ncbi:MAG: Fic family protein [Chloroflexi bacterium]|nr:Fic family protein [Chloroflexota bacterium]